MATQIVLINPFPEQSKGINEATVYPPLGLSYLAAYARKHGFSDIRIIDANILRIPNKKLIGILKKLSPKIVGIQLNVILASAGIELAKIINAELKCRVVIGGPSVSANPREMLQLSSAEIAVIGEGEETFLEIIQGRQLAEIKGVAFFRGEKFVINTLRPLIDPIDNIPFPAFDLLPPLSLYKSRARKKPVGVIITSRGCPYKCTYCNSSIFGKTFRARSEENVISEIDLLVRRYGVKQIDVLDDNFTLDMDRAEGILDRLIQKDYRVFLNLQTGVRADRISDNIVKKMKRAGVIKAGVGIESGDPEILRSVKKGLDLKKAEHAITWLRREGIITIGFFMIGFPEDTKSSIKKTIDFAIKANPHIANFSLLIPFPGTPMYMRLRESGNLKNSEKLFYETGFYDRKIYHKCQHLSEEDIFILQKEAYIRFNFRLAKMIDLFRTIKSFSELKWTVNAVLPVMKRVLLSLSL
jgi:radical SAM superfamily enzyme YgiQ (UPF0313 family)